jgi:hypothetical protein
MNRVIPGIAFGDIRRIPCCLTVCFLMLVIPDFYLRLGEYWCCRTLDLSRIRDVERDHLR